MPSDRAGDIAESSRKSLGVGIELGRGQVDLKLWVRTGWQHSDHDIHYETGKQT